MPKTREIKVVADTGATYRAVRKEGVKEDEWVVYHCVGNGREYPLHEEKLKNVFYESTSKHESQAEHILAFIQRHMNGHVRGNIDWTKVNGKVIDLDTEPEDTPNKRILKLNNVQIGSLYILHNGEVYDVNAEKLPEAVEDAITPSKIDPERRRLMDLSPEQWCSEAEEIIEKHLEKWQIP